MAEKIRLTAQEFFELADETTQPMQLIEGEVIQMVAPVPEHQDLVGNTYVLLRQRAKERGGHAYIAPLDVYFDETNIFQPDIIYLAQESKCEVGEKRLIGAPDLIVEVLSPGTARFDRKQKFNIYEKYGVREYWLIDPTDQFIEVQYHDGEQFQRLGVFESGETFLSTLIGEVAADEILLG
jgi:Uma2 family endonuclease